MLLKVLGEYTTEPKDNPLSGSISQEAYAIRCGDVEVAVEELSRLTLVYLLFLTSH